MKNRTYIHIVGWEAMQHYKKPKPPWIKVYRDILNEYDFMNLTVDLKYTLFALWLLAAETDNSIIDDEEYIRDRLRLTEVPDLDKLVEAGYITRDREKSRLSLVSVEESKEETEEETKTDGNK